MPPNPDLVQAETGSLAEAATLLQRALNIRGRCFGPDHIETAATMVNLSTVQARPEPIFFFFFFTLVTGPRRCLSLKLGDTRLYVPGIRARLGNRNTLNPSLALQPSAITTRPREIDGCV